MLKKVLFISLVFSCSFLKAQTDTSAKIIATPTVEPIVKPKEEKQSNPPALGDVFKPKIYLRIQNQITIIIIKSNKLPTTKVATAD